MNIFFASFFLLNLNQLVFGAYTCISGALGSSATVVACETGNVNCQIVTDMTTSPSTVTGSCTSSCTSSLSTYTGAVCYTGANSNKIGFLCFVGDLFNQGAGQIPVMCNNGHYCQNTVNWTPYQNGSLIPIAIIGSCVSTCTPTQPPTSPCSPSSSCTNTECYMSDFGNKKGNICFVGTFGVDAQIRGCAISNICKYDSSTKTGTCIPSSNCVTTGTVTCFNTDLGNKQGPVCYVGQFNGAKMVNCALGQYCARTVNSNFLTGTTTIGSCQNSCISSSTTFCCQTDLCNAYTPSSMSIKLKIGNQLVTFIMFLIFTYVTSYF